MSKKIKNEQKKFLGETLNQYDKALDEAINQLDKKNREQNHKISSLVNSFDNEYLEKDIEGNMTTLENSKDGMVIINEIQGNTEVNYCKDGEKELILNGDIDTQGESFVTITEGVDGGLVDVSLEGNTEINLSKTKDPVLVTREFDDINCNVGKLQYTIDDVTTINDEPGKVDIDRIVGDTMVNHAVNGSEELILNAHINESGDNNITLNGVTSDGGKVDVALEGNTLVNVSKTKDSVALPLDEELTYLYPATSYTVQFISDKAITADITLGGTKLLAQNIVKGLNRISITTPDTLVDNKLIIDGVGANISNVVVTNTDREFGYFEGMKSVGKGNEIEIEIQNKNLFNGKLYSGWVSDNGVVQLQNLGSFDNILTGYIKVEKNKTYINNFNFTYVWTFDENKKFIELVGGYGDERPKNVRNATYAIFGRSISSQKIPSVDTTTVQIEEGSTATDYIPHQSNKQQLTHEPLRAVGDYKDRYILIDGKWYIERNVGLLDCTKIGVWNKGNGGEFYRYGFLNDIKTEFITDVSNYCKFSCNTYPVGKVSDESKGLRQVAIYNHGNDLKGQIRIVEPSCNTVEEFYTYIQNNPTYVAYPKNTTYEEIDYNPLETYADITHITTNSTIPCNLTVKNHGYNMVALKENTQYTLYVNKNTTNALTYRLGDYVEINSLSKFTFTTPATLTDKTLRITGKGNSVKDLMLIEGTPVNDPVGYFDGLKSSYECEKVADENDENYGKYKVNVKVVGKNLFDGELEQGTGKGSLYTGIHYTQYQNDNDTRCRSKNLIEVIPNTQYTASYSDKGFQIAYWEIDKNGIVTKDSGWMGYNIGKITFNTMPTTRYLKFVFEKNGLTITPSDILMDIQLEQGDTATECEPYFESKQTVYLNSPLLKGDEIVWKDNKIQHYHKMKTIVFDGSNDEKWMNNWTEQYGIPNYTIFNIDVKDKGSSLGYCDLFKEGNLNGLKNECILLDEGGRVCVGFNILNTKLQTQDISGFRQWLQQNPIKVAYELETPYYEEISDYPLKLNVIANSSLSTESTIQVTNISFNIYEETLPYLYPNTKYYITFNADVDRNNIIIDLGGSHTVLDCKVGFNKVEITTPSDTTNLLTFSGTGVNIDHVKVTQQDIDEYFEGMKSVGECEELEITSANSNNTLLNTQQLTHEPLRAVGDAKDRYVLIDGKWYIERNCREMIITSEDISGIGLMEQDLNNGYERYSLSFHSMTNYRAKRPYQKLLNNSFYSQVGWKFEGECMFLNEDNSIGLILNKNRNIGNNHNKLREFLTNNPVKFIYELASPVYEPIDYNPFETYADITHISANSLIPTNVVIKNHGYNCILKPSTKYTVALNKPNGTISAKLGGSAKVDSTNSIFTITTPSTLNDNVLRLSGSGNVKDIMILEGDKTINTPSYFEGIESVFEQEYDAEKGKYRVTARVEGNGKESSMTFYIDEPLRGTGTAKDRVFIQDGKVVVERKYGSVTLDGKETITYISNDGGLDRFKINVVLNPNINLGNISNGVANSFTYSEGLSENFGYFCVYNYGSYLFIYKKLGTTLDEFKQWLQANPTTVVYQLAEPVYEEADCDLSKLVLENYENSSLIFESNIPVSANIRYSGEVPVVTQAKALSSKVDNTTFDINENIIPYMCDIDYRIVELQLMNGDTQGEGIELLGIGDIEILGNENVLFNNRENKKYNYSYDMLKRDILSQRYSKEEYQYRLDRYLLANKISNEEYKELEGLLNNGE